MKSELTQIINQQAHSLAAMSFAVIRMRLREKARAMLQQGMKPDAVARAMQTTSPDDILKQ